jgi:hypothetical protein
VKRLLLSILILFQISASAQRGLDLIDISKFKIKKLSIIDIDGKMRWVHFYDEKGRILKTESGTGQRMTDYSYNDNGLLAELKTFTWQGAQQTLTQTEKNTYDANNRLSKLEIIDDRKQVATWAYEYDAKGNKIKATKKVSGAVASIMLFDYTNGKLVEERLSNQKGLLEKTTYKYDANGFLTEKKWVNTARPVKMEVWKYTNDSSGKRVEEQYFFGRIEAGTYQYQYNFNGLLESWTSSSYGSESKTTYIAELY